MAGTYQEQLAKLQMSMKGDGKRPDMLISILKALVAAFVAFTFLAGFIFTDIPLMRNIYLHFQWHVLAPINQWVAEEPVTGAAIVFLFQAAGVVLVLYLLRSYILFIPVYIAAQFEKSSTPSKAKKVAKKPVQVQRRIAPPSQ